jgi:HopA1 effector protein family
VTCPSSELGRAFRSFWDIARFPAPSVVQWGTLVLDARSLAPELDAAGRQLPPLVAALRLLLYQQVYTRGSRDAADYLEVIEPQPSGPAMLDTELTASLARANAGVERWEGGWAVEAVTPDGALRVRKEHRVRRAAAGEYALHRGPGLGASLGETVSLHVLPQSEWLQPGYYHVLGDTLSSDDEHAELVRLYFAIRASGAAALLRLVAERLNRYLVPFRGKWPTSRAAYQRLDAAVLYVARRDYDFVAELLADAPSLLAEHLSDDVPLCSKRLARGVGLAEEPLTGESFGLHRCRLIAEAVVCARLRGVQSVDAGWSALCEHFAERGHSVVQPWLNPGSSDTYAELSPAAGLAPSLSPCTPLL